MTDTVSIQRPSGEKLNQANRKCETIVGQISKQGADTAASAQELGKGEAILLRIATAKALGQGANETPPDANKLEQLRADIAVAPQVKLALEGRLEAAERERTKERANLRYEQSKYYEATALRSARLKLAEAWDVFRDAAVETMAASHLVFWELNDNRTQMKFTPMEQYGPVAEFLHALHLMNWERYPYDIQPDWLPRQGKFWPDELPGVAERLAELRAEVAQVSE